MRSSRSLFLALLLALVFSGCGLQPSTKVHFAGRTFRVPKTHLITAGIFFLPASQYDRLLFIVDPESPLESQMTVNVLGRSEEWCKKIFDYGVDLAKLPCDTLRGTGSQIDYAALIKGPVDKNKEIDFSWIYRESLASGATGRDVAHCGSINSYEVCHVWLVYKDIIYELDFDGAQIARLPEFQKRVNALLAAWDVTDESRPREKHR